MSTFKHKTIHQLMLLNIELVFISYEWDDGSLLILQVYWCTKG